MAQGKLGSVVYSLLKLAFLGSFLIGLLLNPAKAAASAHLFLPQLNIEQGGELLVPLRLELTQESVDSAWFHINYDPNVVVATAVVSGELIPEGWYKESNVDIRATVMFSAIASGSSLITTSGCLYYISFKAVGALHTSTSLILNVDLRVPDPANPGNSKVIDVTIQNGSLTIANPPCEEKIDMVAGWNWVSFYIEPEFTLGDNSLTTMFGEQANLIYQVKTQNKSATKDPELGWIGDLSILSNISKGAMFKIKTDTPFTLQVNGILIDQNLQIPLQQGWTWIAYIPDLCPPYPYTEDGCSAIDVAVDPILSELHQIKSQIQSKTKDPDGNFEGDLTHLCAGKGYAVKMNNSMRLTYHGND